MNFKEIKSLFTTEGFLDTSFTSLESSVSFEVYKAQIETSNIGGMDFLKSHLDFKNPALKKPFKSAFVALYPYYPNKNELNLNLKVSLYAQQKDYHHRVNKKLQSIIKSLNNLFPNENFEPCVDSKPILERDLGYKSRLGWIGKNTCLINKKHGSLFYITEILSTLDEKQFLTNNSKTLFSTDHCGNCTKCIDACPTQALQPRKLIVEKCISYRNIEDRDCSIKTLDKPIHSWFFGCDICQTVCPWNEKVFDKNEMLNLSKTSPITKENINEIKFILKSSNKELMRTYKEFPLTRARGTGLKRNALKIIYENNIIELKDFLKELSLSDQLEELRQEVIKYLD